MSAFKKLAAATSSLASNFSRPARNDNHFLPSLDPKVAQSTLNQISRQQFESLPANEFPAAFHGLPKEKLKSLYDKHTHNARITNNLATIQAKLEVLSNDELAALMHLENIRGLNATSAHIIAERNRQNAQYGAEGFDRKARVQSYVQELRLAQEAGRTLAETREYLNTLKIFLTFTAHPTKDKNQLAEALFRKRTAIFDRIKDPQERAEALAQNERAMLLNQQTPDKKDTLEDERDFSIASQRTAQHGALNWIEDMQEALSIVYGRRTIDLMDDTMHMDVAERRWQGGDSDGNMISAPRLLALRVMGADAALDDYLEILKDQPELGEEYTAFLQFKGGVNAICENIDALANSTSDSEIFINAKRDFSDAFTKIHYGNHSPEDTAPLSNGWEITREVIENLRNKAHALLENPATAEAGRAAQRAVLMHKQVGIALGKQEIRHNSRDFTSIFDNVFEYIKEQNLYALPDIMKDKKFSELTSKDQALTLKRLMEKHADDMAGWLKAANSQERMTRILLAQGLSEDTEAFQEELGKRMWPNEILERFGVMKDCYNSKRTGFAIIAEANASSAVLQQVLADSFGIENMVHCPLNEDAKTIAEAAQSLRQYIGVFGAKSFLAKKKASPTFPFYFAIMDPRSDAQKGYGLNVAWLQRTTDKELIELAITPILDSLKIGLSDEERAELEGVFVPILRKIGTGASPSRGGMSPMSVPRLFLNILSDMDGIDIYNIPDNLKPVLKQMVNFVSITIQGRDIGMRMGTEESVQDLYAHIATECNAACLAIDGRIDPALVAPLAPKYSHALKAARRRNEEIARDAFSRMRTITSSSKRCEETGVPILDLYVEKVGMPIVSEFSGVGARPPARVKGASKKKTASTPITSRRAIGTDKGTQSTEAYLNSSYTLGLFLQKFHEDYKQGKIDAQDLYDFRNAPFFVEQMLPNAMAALASSDYEYGFDVLTEEGSEWTVERLIALKKNNWRGNDIDEFTRFHAVLAYDALLATSMFEALLDTPDPASALLDSPKPIDALSQAEQCALKAKQAATYLKNSFNKVAKDKYKGYDLGSEEDIIYALYNKGDRLNTLKFGEKTRAQFPFIQSTLEAHQETKLARAIGHEIEYRTKLCETDPGNPKAIDPTTPEGKALLHHIACGVQTQGPVNMSVLLGRQGFGTRPKSVIERIYDAYPQWKRNIQNLIENGQSYDYQQQRVG